MLLVVNYSIYLLMNTGSDSIIDFLLGYPTHELIEALRVILFCIRNSEIIQKCVKNLLSFARFKRFLEAKYRKPTEEQLERDPDCIICREANDKDHSRCLPCGHVFHEDCLKSWIMQQQVRLSGFNER